jgi:hypothetical protein
MPFFICPHCQKETYADSGKLDFTLKCDRCKAILVPENPPLNNTVSTVSVSLDQLYNLQSTTISSPLTRFNLLRTPAQILIDDIKTTPPVTDLAFRAHIHNDTHEQDDIVTAIKLDMLVIRGASFDLQSCGTPMTFAANVNGFEVPTIIRDCYKRGTSLQNRYDRPKHGVVTTHMQTKSILAWTKSLRKGVEYAKGNGFLYFTWCEYGLDVEATVKSFENTKQLGTLPDYGTQAEVLTAAVSKNRILGVWKVVSVGGSESVQFNITEFTDNMVLSPSIPISVKTQYAECKQAMQLLLSSKNNSVNYETLPTSLDPESIK